MSIRKKTPVLNRLIPTEQELFDVDLIISLGVAALLSTIKNPNKKQAVKKIALKVRNSINTAYAGDPDF